MQPTGEDSGGLTADTACQARGVVPAEDDSPPNPPMLRALTLSI